MKINLQTINLFNNKFSYKKDIQQNQNVGLSGFVASNPFLQINSDRFEISFTSEHCSEKNFEIKNIENLRCPACGLIMLTDAQISSFVNDVANKKGKCLASTLEKYEDESVITKKESQDTTGNGIYRPIKKEVVNILKVLAVENPELSLQDLVKLQARRCIDALIARQMIVVDELDEYIKTNVENEGEKEALLKKLEEYVKQIKGESDEIFARKKFIYNIKRVTQSIDRRNDIEVIASKMPTSENDINSFFVKYANSEKAQTSKDIAKKLVNQAIPTAEHMKPKSKGGKDRISNYMCDCADCNSKRGNIDFDEWVLSIPGFEQRLQEYVEDVQDIIDFDMLSQKYDNYAEVFINTVSELTDGEIVLDIPDTKNPSKIEALMKRRAREIEQMTALNEKLVKKQQRMQQEIEYLESYDYFEQADAHREILDELKAIETEIGELSTKLIDMRSPLYHAKNDIDTLQDEIEKIGNEDEKQELLAQFENKNKVYQQMLQTKTDYEARLEKIKQRQIKLKKQKKSLANREDEVVNNIELLRLTIAKVKAAQEKLDKVSDLASRVSDFQAKVNETKAEIDGLEQENKRISSIEGFNPSNTDDYNTYLHKLELLNVSEGLLSTKAYKKSTYSAGLGREVIEIARDVIKREVEELSSKDSVVYFVNLNRSKQLKTKYDSDNAKLEQAIQAREQQEALEEEIKSLCENKTLEQLIEECDVYLEEKRILDSIANITEQRLALEHITKVVKKNQMQLDKLANYREMTNAQYAEIVDFIELHEVE